MILIAMVFLYSYGFIGIVLYQWPWFGARWFNVLLSPAPRAGCGRRSRGNRIVALNPEDVRNIAELARLSVSDEEIPDYVRSLSDILEFVRQMNDADTGGVTPMAHPLPMSQPLRADTVTEDNQRESFQAISPRVDRGLFLVPRVIE